MKNPFITIKTVVPLGNMDEFGETLEMEHYVKHITGIGSIECKDGTEDALVNSQGGPIRVKATPEEVRKTLITFREML